LFNTSSISSEISSFAGPLCPHLEQAESTFCAVLLDAVVGVPCPHLLQAAEDDLLLDETAGCECKHLLQAVEEFLLGVLSWECSQREQILSDDETLDIALVYSILKIPNRENIKCNTYFCICYPIISTYDSSNRSKLSHGKIEFLLNCGGIIKNTSALFASIRRCDAKSARYNIYKNTRELPKTDFPNDNLI
jgi:hypothetical protein